MDAKPDSLASFSSWLAAVARTPRVPPLVPGTMVGERYLIVGVLGAGGMGVVYRARDLRLQRDVAVKLCAHVTAEDDRRLLGEALAMAQLQHQNVITVYEVGRFGEELFLVMELVAGPTLRSWLGAERRRWRDVVRLYLDAAAGLHAIHFAGLIHGDLKPDNLLVGGDGRARIADFGLARPDGDVGGIGGTPRYMAPELAAGDFPSQRSDQYAFCFALAESLRAAGGVPRGLAALIARGLADDPMRRHASMAALRHALLVQLDRRRRFVSVGAAAMLALFLLVAAGWVAGRAAATRSREASLYLAELELQGRSELAHDNTTAALAYLATALERGRDRPAIRFLLARGLAAREQSSVALTATAPVTAVAWVGGRAVVGDAAGVVRFFEADGRLVRELAAHRGRVSTLAASEHRLLTAGADGAARLWDVDTGTRLAELAGHEGPILGAAFTDDEQVLTRGQDGTARLWNAQGRELRRFVHGARVTAALAAGDVVYTAGSDAVVRAWSRSTGKAGFVFAGAGPILTAALAGDRLSVATGGLARVFDTRTGKTLADLRHPDLVTEVRWTPGGRLLTACDDKNARLWDIADAAVVTKLEGHDGPLTALQLTPDGARVVTAADDFSVRVWDLTSGRTLATLTGQPSGVHALAVGPGNLVLAGADDGTARLWSVVPGDFVGSLATGAELRDAWFTGRDQIFAVLEDGTLAVFDLHEGGWRRSADRGKVPLAEPGATALTPDGARYVAATAAGLELRDLELRSTPLSVPRIAAGVTSAPDGSAFVAFGEGAFIVDAATASVTRELHGPPIVAAAATPHAERVALLGADGTLVVWQADGVTALPRPAGVGALAIDRSGTWVALGGRDAEVSIWDASSGWSRRTLGRHGAPVQALRFAPDGALLFTLGSDLQVRVWDVAEGGQLAVLHVDGAAGFDLSPDGTRLLVRNRLGGVSVWDVSRDLRAPGTIAEVVRCVVGLEVDDLGHVVPATRKGFCP